jgi:hypothetical protein
MRAMVDLDIVGCGWAKIPKYKWKELPKTDGYKAPYERLFLCASLLIGDMPLLLFVKHATLWDCHLRQLVLIQKGTSTNFLTKL